jgi:Anticodon binding domain
MKSQLKSADRSGARVALIVGPDEVAAGTISLRPLRGVGEQRSVPLDAVVEAVQSAGTAFANPQSAGTESAAPQSASGRESADDPGLEPTRKDPTS